MSNCNRAELYCKHLSTIVAHQNIIAAVATTAASCAAIFIGWWSFSFHYVAKMATIEDERCPAFHTQLFDRYEYTIWVLIVHCILP